MTVNSMDERVSRGMMPLVRRTDAGMDGDVDGDSVVGGTGDLSLDCWRRWCIRLAVWLIMGLPASPCIVVIAMSIEAEEMCCFFGLVGRGDKVGGFSSWVVRVCKGGLTGAEERADGSGQFAALHNG